jgi:hypothetical protein
LRENNVLLCHTHEYGGTTQLYQAIEGQPLQADVHFALEFFKWLFCDVFFALDQLDLILFFVVKNLYFFVFVSSNLLSSPLFVFFKRTLDFIIIFFLLPLLFSSNSALVCVFDFSFRNHGHKQQPSDVWRDHLENQKCPVKFFATEDTSRAHFSELD